MHGVNGEDGSYETTEGFVGVETSSWRKAPGVNGLEGSDEFTTGIVGVETFS